MYTLYPSGWQAHRWRIFGRIQQHMYRRTYMCASWCCERYCSLLPHTHLFPYDITLPLAVALSPSNIKICTVASCFTFMVRSVANRDQIAPIFSQRWRPKAVAKKRQSVFSQRHCRNPSICSDGCRVNDALSSWSLKMSSYQQNVGFPTRFPKCANMYRRWPSSWHVDGSLTWWPQKTCYRQHVVLNKIGEMRRSILALAVFMTCRWLIEFVICGEDSSSAILSLLNAFAGMHHYLLALAAIVTRKSLIHGRRTYESQ